MYQSNWVAFIDSYAFSLSAHLLRVVRRRRLRAPTV